MIPSDLAEGYQRFRAGRYAQEAELYEALAGGQSPNTMIIGCADSRVDPATIFSAGPGELFVVRNVAALVPPNEDTGGYHGTSAALEFAVTHLKVTQIVVLGHARCGGAAAALAAADNRPVGTFIGPWVELLADISSDLHKSAGALTPDQLQQRMEHLAIQKSLRNLLTFPFVKSACDAAELTLHGAWFSIASGELQWLDAATGTFHRVPE